MTRPRLPVTVLSGNLGSALPRRRGRDPMRAYDALPPPLRRWLAQAALPWSPASCRRVWQKARARGEPLEAVLARLDRAERATLARDPLASPLGVAPEGGERAP